MGKATCSGASAAHALRSASREHAELIALRIRQHNPGHRTLPDVDATGTYDQEPVNLDPLVRGTEVQVQPILGLLSRRDWCEDHAGQAVRRGRISNSSADSFTTTHPKTSAHHRPSTTGSRASTTTCSHSRLIRESYNRRRAGDPRRSSACGDHAGQSAGMNHALETSPRSGSTATTTGMAVAALLAPDLGSPPTARLGGIARPGQLSERLDQAAGPMGAVPAPLTPRRHRSSRCLSFWGAQDR